MSASESRIPRMRRIDELCDQFEQDWTGGHRPSLEVFLGRVAKLDQAELFRALLSVELELRRGPHASCSKADYIRRFPDYHQEILDAFAQESPNEDAEDQPTERPKATPIPSDNQIVMQVISGPQAGRAFTFQQHDTFLVGRSPRAHLRLEGDPHFSRFHFRLEVSPPLCYLIDLGSSNGTFVNGNEVRECYLQDGDIISGGKTELKIRSQSSEQTLMLPRSAPLMSAVPSQGSNMVPQESPSAAVGPEPAATEIARPVIPAAETVPLPQNLFPTSAAPGTEEISIPGYELQEEIGHGDLGTVYRAIQVTSGQTVAIKVMTPAVSVADKALKLFLRECAVLSQLNHPHIVKLLDQGTGQRHLYIVTEYVPTVSWSDQLKSRSLKTRVRICCGLLNQVLSAIQFAHARSLVHRDIKPGNILISRDGKMLSAKLADFGVAKHYTNAGLSQITRAGDVVGSLPYMPTEQFLNSREAKPACDLYAAGATLYHWLTGQTPHDFPAGRNQFLVVLEDAPIPISQRLPEIPKLVAEFLDRALARQPEQRFLSAEEMRHALKAILD